MSTKTKILALLSCLVAVMLAAACGTEPGQAVQNSRQTEAQAEESAPTPEQEAGAEAQAEAQEAEAPQEEQDRTAEAEEQGEEQAEDEDEHNEDAPKQDEAPELSAVDLARGEKLKVVATTNIVGDLVRNVGGDMIELTGMLPIGSDPHTFAPTPQDAASVADAHVVFVNGLHLEEFLEELVGNAGGEASIVALSTNVEIREFEEMAGHRPDHGEGEPAEDEREQDAEVEKQGGDERERKAEPDHTHDGADPHIWMTPFNAIIMVRNIEHALSELDPAHAAAYAANAAAYAAQLEELDAWVISQIETIPVENRELVTDHDAFGYYTDRYGLEVVGAIIPAYSTNAEPSAWELAELQEAIGQLDAQAVFIGTTINPVLAERLAEDIGIKLVPLYTGSLGQAGSGVESYLDFIHYNTTAIVKALK